MSSKVESLILQRVQVIIMHRVFIIDPIANLLMNTTKKKRATWVDSLKSIKSILYYLKYLVRLRVEVLVYCVMECNDITNMVKIENNR